MYTLLAYHDGAIRHMIESTSVRDLAKYARGFTRDQRAEFFCESVVILRGGMESALEASAVVAIVVLGEVFRPQ
jgi:hypothetical protein